MKKLISIFAILAMFAFAACEEQGDVIINPDDKPNTEQPGDGGEEGEQPGDGGEDIENPEDNPNTQKIFYTSIDGAVVTPYKTDTFGANIVSNTYADGEGVIIFDGDVTMIDNDSFRDCASLKSITIPNSVTKIGEYAFRMCVSLKSVTIPDSVIEIGDDAFTACYGIESLTIGDGVTSIGDWAFQSCAKLTSVTLGNSVASIGTSAFYNCNTLTSITIPESVTEMGDWVFFDCLRLESVYCRPTTPPTAFIATSHPWYTFDLNSDSRKIYVPTESVEAYKAATGWSEYADSIEGYDFQQLRIQIAKRRCKCISFCF